MHWIVYALLGALAAALGTVFAKIGLLKNIDSSVLTTIRGIVMALTVLLVTLSIGSISVESLKNIDTRTWVFVILSGVCGAVSWMLFYYALSQGSIAAVTSIDKLSIVITIVLAALLLGEKITLEMAIGVALISIGTLLVSAPKDFINSLFSALK
jgi:bacterial/archaeal transporter family protein